MICISNGLIPDLGGLAEENFGAENAAGNVSSSAEPVVQFSYDNTLEEIDGAMKSFQARFKSKRGIFSIAAYSLITAAVIVSIVINPTSVFAYAALLFCAVGLIYSITDRSRARRRTIDALRDMNPEEYTAAFYNDKIEIDTVIKPKANEVRVKIDEQADDEAISPLKTTFVIGDDLLEFIENDESLLLVFNRQQIYCFPKRCLSVEQEDKVRDFLTEKLSGQSEN